MTDLVHLTPLHPHYPSRLRGLHDPPASVTVQGGAVEAVMVVAVIGSREPWDEALKYTKDLAYELASRGAVVASGGAVGIDGAAHRGALDAPGGRTWVVAPTGHLRCFPREHKVLFDTVARGPGAMIWPFAPTYAHRSAFHARNNILAAISDAVVVIQAGPDSGALHAAGCARRLGKPLWVLPTAPWTQGFEGSHTLIDDGATPLTSTHRLLATLGLVARGNRPTGGASRTVAAQLGWAELTAGLSDREIKVFGATSTAPRHADAISASAGTSPQATTAALLTLALENVLVEGPPGFFRRREAPNR